MTATQRETLILAIVVAVPIFIWISSLILPPWYERAKSYDRRSRRFLYMFGAVIVLVVLILFLFTIMILPLWFGPPPPEAAA